MVRFLLITSSPLVKVMFPVTPKTMVSPGLAVAIASRSEPGPLSFRFVTVSVAARTGEALENARTTSAMQMALNNTFLLFRSIDEFPFPE